MTIEHRKVRDHGLVGDFCYCDDGTRHLAVILLGGSEGGNKAWEDWMDRIAEWGYAVLSLAYFKEKGLPRSLENVPLEYFETAMAWLTAHPAVVPHHYAVIGASKGGELALLLASRYPAIRAVVGVVPSSVVFQGIPSGFSFGPPPSSWSYKGKGLPYVPIHFSLALIKGLLTGRFLDCYTESLKDKAAVEWSTIPVENINGPILLASGNHDQMWPSTFMCAQIVKRLNTFHYKHHYTHIAYDTGHNAFAAPDCGKAIGEFLSQHFVSRQQTRGSFV